MTQPTEIMSKEYDHEEEEYKARMRHWGMHDKESYDVTEEDCLNDLAALRKIHGSRIKGIIIIPIYEHLDMQELEKQNENLAYIDKPPTHSYLCSGGVPIYEAVGAIEAAKFKILE